MVKRTNSKSIQIEKETLNKELLKAEGRSVNQDAYKQAPSFVVESKKKYTRKEKHKNRVEY